MGVAKAAVLLAGILLFAAPAAGLTIRGDRDWVSSTDCPDGWESPGFDDSAWGPIAYPWLLLWPVPFEPDPAARPFWDASAAGIACTRRTFDLAALPSGPASAHVFVDDDYDFWLNGHLVARNQDSGAERPGERYDVRRFLRRGKNVIGLKLVDVAYEKGAYFSLSLPGLPEQGPSASARWRALLPWAKFAGILLAAIAGVLLLARMMRRLEPALARCPPWLAAGATLVLAAACQYVLQANEMYTAMPEQPSAEWNWSAVLLAAVLFLALFSLRHADGAPENDRPLRRQWLWLAAILVLAAVLRIYDIDRTPVGFYQDEATNGNDALLLMEFDDVYIWSDSVGGRPTFFLYLLGFCLKLFGVSYLSLKVLPIAMSIASVAAVYAVGRVGLGIRAALWAAFFLAVSRWHIHYARMAWEVNCVPFFSAAGFAFLLHGLRRERGGAGSIVAGAVILTFGLYTYAAYRAVPVAAVLFLLGLLFSSDRSLLRRHAFGLTAAAVATAFVALPLVVFAFTDPQRYWERYNDVSLTYYISYYGTPLPWLHQLGKGFLSLTSLGDDLIRHNLPRASQLDPITGVFFFLGLATGPRREQRLGMRLLWVWFGVFLALASLTRDAPHATRYLGLVTPAVIFAGFGAARLFARLRLALRWAPAVWVLVFATASATTALNAYQYFVLEASDPNQDFEMNLTARVICERVRRYDAVAVHWTSDVAYWAGGPCHFLARGAEYNDLLPEDLQAARLGDRIKRPALFFVGPELLEPSRNLVARDENDLPVLGLPGLPEIQRDREGRLMFYVWELPAEK